MKTCTSFFNLFSIKDIGIPFTFLVPYYAIFMNLHSRRAITDSDKAMHIKDAMFITQNSPDRPLQVAENSSKWKIISVLRILISLHLLLLLREVDGAGGSVRRPPSISDSCMGVYCLGHVETDCDSEGGPPAVRGFPWCSSPLPFPFLDATEEELGNPTSSLDERCRCKPMAVRPKWEPPLRSGIRTLADRVMQNFMGEYNIRI